MKQPLDIFAVFLAFLSFFDIRNILAPGMLSLNRYSGAAANGSPGRHAGHESAKERAKRFLSDVVLCHNDLLSGNVLHADGWDRVQVRELL